MFFFIFYFYLHFDNTFVVSRFDSTLPFPPFLKSSECFISSSFFLFSLFKQKVARIEERKQKIHSGSHDFRNKCFPVKHLSVSNWGCMQHDAARVEVVLVKQRQVNMSLNKAWVHFAATLPPGHRPLHIQVKSAFCLPKPCDLWPGSIDQTS